MVAAALVAGAAGGVVVWLLQPAEIIITALAASNAARGRDHFNCFIGW